MLYLSDTRAKELSSSKLQRSKLASKTKQLEKIIQLVDKLLTSKTPEKEKTRLAKVKEEY